MNSTHTIPTWFKILGIMDLAVYALVGGFLISAMNAVLPYGNAQPSADAVLQRYAVGTVGIPLVGIMGIVAIAFVVYRRGLTSVGRILVIAPLPLLPAYLAWSLA